MPFHQCISLTSAVCWLPGVGGWRVTRLLLPALIGLVAVASINPASMAAHAYLDESSPAPNEIVATAPTEVVLTFTEPLERSYSRAELYDSDGNSIPDATSREGDDEYTMVLDLPANLPNGIYSVLWRTLSTADGHTAQNYVPFTIGTIDDVDPAAVTMAHAEEAHGSGSLSGVARWSALFGLAAALSAWPMWLLVFRPSISPMWQVGPKFTRLMRRYTTVAVMIAILGSLFALMVQASALTDGNFLDKIRITLGDTRYGTLWFARIVLLFAYGLLLQWLAWWWPRRQPLLSITGLLVAVTLPIPFSLISHASAQTTGRSSAIFNDVVHLLAASLWVGGIFTIVAVLIPALKGMSPDDRRLILARVLPRFSAIALTAWATLALTGFYSAWLQVGSIDALRTTEYGESLTLKLIILLPILILAAFNFVVVTRRLQHHSSSIGTSSSWTRRFAFAVGAEAALAVAVLMVVGTLTGQAPAREDIVMQSNDALITFPGDDRQAKLTLAPGVPGPNQFQLNIDGEPVPHDADVLMRVELPDQDTGEREITMSHTDTNDYVHVGSELSMAGDWDFTLIIRPQGESEWRSAATYDLEVNGAGSDTASSAWLFSAFGGMTGLLLTVAGFAGLAYTATWSASRYRPLVGAVAVVAIAIGLAVLVIGRLDTDPNTPIPREGDSHSHMD